MLDLDFYYGKKVFLTGHTGFKGSWMTRVLLNAGALVTGYSLPPSAQPSLFNLAGVESYIDHIAGDIRDFGALKEAFDQCRPEIVIHMAAQPLVRNSYQNPLYTYETNVMGTLHLLECIRLSNCVKSFLNVTTDKVYLNNEWCWGYRENEPLDGFDPYSNSKSCSELATHCYKNSFFETMGIATSTARAGNVIGGGDFAKDRIIPDCIRAQQQEIAIGVRNPSSTRPYQHVLDPIMAYLMIAQKQYQDAGYAGWYNVGPDDCDCVTTGQLVELFCRSWGGSARWENQAQADAPHEANFLKLDSTLLKKRFGWEPRWHIAQAIDLTCEWTKIWLSGGSVSQEMDRQIQAYFN